MLAFGLALIVVVVVIVCVVGFTVWAIHEHLMARKFRWVLRKAKEIEESGQPVGKGGGWKVVYQEGKARKTIVVHGNTEKEALGAFYAAGIKFDKIWSMDKE